MNKNDSYKILRNKKWTVLKKFFRKKLKTNGILTKIEKSNKYKAAAGHSNGRYNDILNTWWHKRYII